MMELYHFKISSIVNATYEVGNFFHDSFQYKKLHWDDVGDQNILENLDSTVDSIHKSLTENKNVLVHCYLGRSRSVSIIIAYLCKYKNMTVDEALKFIQGLRPQARPNSGFMNQLNKFIKIKTEHKP